MSLINAIFFGIVQGLTEFFPVSSSAHLAVMGNLFGVASSDFNYQMFTVFVHFGTIIALLITYWNDLLDMVYEVILMFAASSNPQYRKARYPSARLFLMLAFATVPLLFAVSLNSYMTKLSNNSIFIGTALLLTGCILFVAGKFVGCTKGVNNITIIDSLIIGVCQIVASIPGISRVGVTMTAGIATGLSPEFSLKFAYLLSIPASVGVNMIRLIDAANLNFTWNQIPMCLIGMAFSMITGIFAIKIMKSAVKEGSFRGFAYYCWVVGILFIILTMIF